MPRSASAQSRFAQRLFCVGIALGLEFFALSAAARKNGIAAPGCTACHGDSAQSTISMSADPSSVGLGSSITFTVTIARPGVAVGGLYVPDPGIGQLGSISGEGLSLSSAGLTHSSPKPAQSGLVTFRFSWRAPNQPGAVHFEVYGNAANGDGTVNGDAPGSGVFSYTFGCTPQTFYFDADGDGFGAEQFASTLGCTNQPAPIGYAATKNDCDDAHDSVHPGATELCNGRDDNCNGTVDEGAAPQELWPDEDGDGYYATKTGTPMIGCINLAGYAVSPGDCAPRDPTRHPGAPEVCNLLDDNCDGRVDEGLRPQCGVGFCRRQSSTCDFADCVPGLPGVETCNLLDDDCDGEVDEGNLCPAGQACAIGSCVPLGDIPSGAGAGAGAGAGTGMGASAGALGNGGGQGGGPSAPSSATPHCAVVHGGATRGGARSMLTLFLLAVFAAIRRRQRAA